LPFGVVAFHFQFNRRTVSTPNKLKTHAPSQITILFQTDLCLKKGMGANNEKDTKR